jgi:hypothetical protein
MSLFYNCLFAGPAPDLHQLLNQLVDEQQNEASEAIEQDTSFCFFENNGAFSLYYIDDEYIDNEDADSKAMLLIYPHIKEEMYTLAFGDFKVESSWYIDTNHSQNMAIADEAFARLLRGVLKQYKGDFVTLFNGEQVILYRTGGRIYLSQGSDIAQEPLLSLLDLQAYELRAYDII